MSFFYQKVVCSFINHFRNWLLIIYIKVQKRYKRQQINKSENKESAEFDEYKSNNEYIPFSSFLFQTKSNCPSNLRNKTRSLTYLVSITKKKSC